jgi:ATP-dependent Clp protease protease subunit
MFSTTPIVFEPGMHGEQAYDVFSWLMKNKTIFLASPLDDTVGNIICAQLLYAEKQGIEEIDMFINSPGGYLTTLFSIVDVMESVKVKVNTICVGHAASAAAILLTQGHKRYATKRSRIMFHDVSYGMGGTYKDQKIQFDETTKARNEITEMLAKSTNVPRRDIDAKLMDRDFYMSAQDAIDLGVIDGIYQGK